MRQRLMADGFEQYRKKTRKERFLEDMNTIVPWNGLMDAIKPFYPKRKSAGRPPIGIERMLRIYFLQHWFNFSEPAAEEAIYDSRAIRQFVRIDLGNEPAPDETTICKFRHLMERHNLRSQFFQLVNEYLQENGMKIKRGTIVDSTIINAPSSTKNKKKERDPDMRQTRKGNQWYFGMKAHIGVDSHSKQIHSVVATSANVHDSTVIGKLLHGKETRLWGDAAYTGKQAAIKAVAPQAQNFTQKKNCRHRKLTERERAANRYKSKTRARVEHLFGIMKGRFGFTKVRYKSINKNAHHLFVICALTNLVVAKGHLLKHSALIPA